MIVDTGSQILHDPDIDRPRAVTGAIPAGHARRYQRLLVSPLPMVLGCLLAAVLVRHALGTRDLWLFLASVGLFAASLPLFQFHCLDCGRIGWYLRATRHACEAVTGRYRRGEPERTRMSAQTQCLLWIYVMVGGLLVASVFALGRL
ncbi:hypothetical protein OJF2_52290 [Aquisphaera giovannonii]|uniref:Uncharacterized protein n=1 Tax=Aquisphaera giovannonii TaxID=406548 RepID=A0A5B9W8Q2_9BACT|nr:hypothetical protein [Aquisphaera giovannonii]QEH36644.1 hypothetical protein OJF2_52290 [Aquisphaera giovannonii]